MFPSRNPFYTYEGLINAAATFPEFAGTGDTATRKREVAAFLANVNHETGGLVYVEEIAKATYCDTSWGPAVVARPASSTTAAAPSSSPGTVTTALPATRSGCPS